MTNRPVLYLDIHISNGAAYLYNFSPAANAGQVKSSQVVGLRDRVAIRTPPVASLRGQVKSSSGATHSRSEHPDPNLLLPSSLRGLWRGLLVEVGRRRSLSEAACYRNCPRSR